MLSNHNLLLYQVYNRDHMSTSNAIVPYGGYTQGIPCTPSLFYQLGHTEPSIILHASHTLNCRTADWGVPDVVAVLF